MDLRARIKILNQFTLFCKLLFSLRFYSDLAFSNSAQYFVSNFLKANFYQFNRFCFTFLLNVALYARKSIILLFINSNFTFLNIKKVYKILSYSKN